MKKQQEFFKEDRRKQSACDQFDPGSGKEQRHKNKQQEIDENRCRNDQIAVDGRASLK